MTKALVFDSSSIISISMNGLLDVLKSLKEKYHGEFFVSDSVKKEIVDDPFKSKMYKLEAMRIADFLDRGIFKTFKNVNIDNKVNGLLTILNNIFRTSNHYLSIVDRAEVESLVLAQVIDAEAYVVDERTIRLLVEDPGRLLNLLSRKLRTKVDINRNNLSKFQNEIKDVKILRSSELITVAFELGLLTTFKDGKMDLLDGALWGLKLRGCSISGKEIEDVLELEKFK